MPKTFDRLLLAPCIIGLITLSGCTNHNKNSGLYGNDIKTMLVYDLNGKNSHYAENQMRNRGYRETRRDGKHSWWYNEDNNYCYQLEESDGKVRKVNTKSDSECWHGHHSNSHNSHANDNPKALPDSAKSACINRFGRHNFAYVQTLSPLKPGYWELIMQGKDGRKAACTVNKHGSIEDWVEL
jgi:hypothetical protein